jgi:peptide/nickel transport system permease protein
MFAYIMRRLGTLVVILFGSSFILDNLTAISGDPTEQYKFATDLRAKQELAGLIRQLDLNTPPPLRYFKWLKGILKAFTGHIDFGTTRNNELLLNSVSSGRSNNPPPRSLSDAHRDHPRNYARRHHRSSSI